MNADDDIVKKAYEANQAVFDEEDRAKARLAYEALSLNVFGRSRNALVYQYDVNPDQRNAGLRTQFSKVDEARVVVSHNSNIKFLALRINALGDAVAFLESVQDRVAVERNVKHGLKGQEDMITWQIEPFDVFILRRLHARLVEYVNELRNDQESDRTQVVYLAREISQTLDGIDDLSHVLNYLEAINKKPKTDQIN